MTFAAIANLGEQLWRTENGLELKTNELRPIVDTITGRLFALTPLGDVVLLHEYERYRRSSARDAAIMFWGDPSSWASLGERIVSCGCESCRPPVAGFSSDWEITEWGQGVIRARLVAESGLAPEEHLIYLSPFVLMDGHGCAGGSDAEPAAQYTRDVEIDTFCAMIERFGEPYDMATGEINPAFVRVYGRSGA